MNDKNVNHPAHYGGADDPFETIKVLEARLSPQEFAGFLAGNAYKYADRHKMKGGLEDLKKGLWYQNRLVAFIESRGHDIVYPKPVFWIEGSAPTEDVEELAVGQPIGKAFAIHCSVEPHVRWGVRFLVGDELGRVEGDDLKWFGEREKAKQFAGALKIGVSAAVHGDGTQSHDISARHQ